MTDEVREALTREMRYWRTRCLEVADLYPPSIFSCSSDSREAAAGAMANHVATTIGIWLAGRYEALESGSDETLGCLLRQK